MDRQTLAALRGSIEKWERIVDGTGIDQGIYNCPLCKLFYANHCSGCPVNANTRQKHCNGSKYFAWASLFNDFETMVANNPRRVAAAKAELEYLRSLLPRKAK